MTTDRLTGEYFESFRKSAVEGGLGIWCLVPVPKKYD